jgi:hypothetical protein
MEFLIIVALVIVSYTLGLYSGVWLIYRTLLKPGLAKGILEVGNDTYRVSKFVQRNTRI